MTKKNPFNPTFGDVPPLFLDKGQTVAKLVTLIKQSDFARSFFITGVRGSGKTAFLTRVSNELQSDPNCYSIDLLNHNGILTSLARQLDDLSNPKAIKMFDSIKSLSIDGVSISRDTEAPNVDQLLDQLMQHIANQHKYVVITIDEVTNSKSISDFAQVFSALKRKGYPIFCHHDGAAGSRA
ncbi:ATP-binding protein [Limosilactobacillus kribbianus]|uniref:ATP-binding protein n=1 Tax=Limosilactobacillus kribbianus TaxID=2982695 RepID=UPI0022649BF5|nr:ATP-binding protein [Limosilactobacillus kribbianus]